MSTRRDAIATVLTAFPVYAMLAEWGAAQAAAPAGPPVRRWIGRQHDIARALAYGHLDPAHWQDEVEALARDVDLDELMAEIGRADSRFVGRALPSYPVKRIVHFRNDNGDLRQLRYTAALFAFDRDNVITPHGHRHMVSAHIVVKGAFRVRTFDRVREEDGAVVIRPATDDTFASGDVTSIGPDRNNVHWLVPLNDGATTFDIIVSGLDAGQPDHVIDALDPLGGTALPDGSIRAPVIDFEDASRLYTPDV
jgi:hypothetical protein